MAHCHPAKREQQAPLVFGRQRLPNRVERTFGHRAIQASAPRRTTPGSQSAADRRVASTYQRCLVWDIENFFARLKQYRAIATRYDKTARNFLAAIHLAAAVIWLN